MVLEKATNNINEQNRHKNEQAVAFWSVDLEHEQYSFMSIGMTTKNQCMKTRGNCATMIWERSYFM